MFIIISLVSDWHILIILLHFNYQSYTITQWIKQQGRFSENNLITKIYFLISFIFVDVILDYHTVSFRFTSSPVSLLSLVSSSFDWVKRNFRYLVFKRWSFGSFSSNTFFTPETRSVNDIKHAPPMPYAFGFCWKRYRL